MSSIQHSLRELFEKLNGGSILATFALSIAVFSLCDSEPACIVWYLLLSTTWLFYMMDHLLDSRENAMFEKLASRHCFSSRQFFYYEILCGLVFLSNAALAILFLGQWLVLFGVVLFILIFAHLFSCRSLARYPKELAASFLYLLTLWGVALISNEGQMDIDLVLCMFIVFAVVFLNMILLSEFDTSYDRRHGFLSIRSQLSLRTFRILFVLTGLLGVSLALLNVFTSDNRVVQIFSLFCVIVSLVYLALLFFKQAFVFHRSLVDTLLLPFVALAFV